MSTPKRNLTRAEEQIMQELWEIKKGFVMDVINRLPNPKPAYNTVSTIIRILEKKGFVGHIAKGKSHQYYPLITKKAYRKNLFKSYFRNYFNNSHLNFTSFFTKNQRLSLEELEEMKKLIDEEIEKKNKKS